MGHRPDRPPAPADEVQAVRDKGTTPSLCAAPAIYNLCVLSRIALVYSLPQPTPRNKRHMGQCTQRKLQRHNRQRRDLHRRMCQVSHLSQ